MKTRRIHKLAAWLIARDDIAITAHVNPDGDAIGSTLGLMLALRQIGKRCFVSLSDPIPKTYRFLPHVDEIVTPDRAPFPPRYVVMVDCVERERTGTARALIEGAEECVCIDHHNTSEVTDEISVIDTSAAASAELILLLTDALGGHLTRESADCLYAAIITDCGSFAYDSTTPDTFRLAARCAEQGIDIAGLNYRLFRERTAARTKLLGRALNSIEFLRDGRVALIQITLEMLRSCNATSDEVEKIINFQIETAGVEVALLAEETSGGTRLSFRSRDYVDVSAIAAELGGGGHKRASGAMTAFPIDEAIEAALALIDRALENR